ncbi:hypothetical protein FACUT_7407 [Fusarium acutatum]|uniref:Peptidase S8/S53 domain-containing protein n=1 Tax=Fusarium acutatum TaxID=78861 RepID=A0A8H4NKE3_9HYPO|nr:hypothetical protein FACUT_7407 [Fusarium acutatum]
MGAPATSAWEHSLRYKEIATLSRNIRSQGISSKPVFGMTVGPRTVEMMQNDWGFPSAKIVKAILHSSNTTTLLPKPSRVELKHYSVFQSQAARTILLPQSYFCILSKGSCSDEDAWEVRMNLDTTICHETNRLGRLVVTLQNTTATQAISQGQQRPEGDVPFYFDLREDAELFAAYLRAAQGRLRELFARSPMENEKMVAYQLLGANHGHSTQAKIKDKVPQISQKGLLKSSQDLEIWTSDYDESGKPIVCQISWEELTRRGTKPRNLRATFIKSAGSENERTAGDWLDEVDDLIRAMRGDRNDRHERVKIATIDSGLHDRERSHYRAVYKDFTGVTTNDSWHGTCCVGIIQGIYEEARLYIARVFERDHADEIEGPLRMARAIHWAIEPPCSVDIISISAGFRNYSRELDEAVTKAKAAGILVIAAASNWQNTNTVAFPARHNLSTICIYSTNTGNQSSSFNPEPRADTQNFAILGEGFQHPDQRRNERMGGTSMATAVAAGLAARIVDFSRQKDNKA